MSGIGDDGITKMRFSICASTEFLSGISSVRFSGFADRVPGVFLCFPQTIDFFNVYSDIITRVSRRKSLRFFCDISLRVSFGGFIKKKSAIPSDVPLGTS